MADMMGMFDAPSAPPPANQTPFGGNNLMNGFEGLDLGGHSAPPPPGQQLGHTEPPKSNGGGSEDLLDLM